MAVKKTSKGYFVEKVEQSVLTPRDEEVQGVYLELGTHSIWVNYPDAVDKFPGLQLPADSKFLLDLSIAIAKLAKEVDERRNFRGR